jgi:hypothetical protein
MTPSYRLLAVATLTVACPPVVAQQAKHEITVAGTAFRLNGEPFPYAGVSFFNAIYNPAFNKSSTDRRVWLGKFKKYGVNVLRVWVQWDNARGFADAARDHTLYHPDGTLRAEHVTRLKAILVDCDAEGVVVELTLFSQESWREGIRIGPAETDKAVAALARELLPFRNVTFQVWNEMAERTLDVLKVIKAADPKRLVTSSPGFAGVLGDPAHNAALDYLTPHTSRQNAGKPWELAPAEVAYLLKRYRKPVVDDEPARTGTAKFGGPKEPTSPFDHVLHIHEVRKAGGYVTYHHDMFQTGYGSPAVPPSGVPDPEFSPYHRTVFEFLARRDRYQGSAR